MPCAANEPADHSGRHQNAHRHRREAVARFGGTYASHELGIQGNQNGRAEVGHAEKKSGNGSHSHDPIAEHGQRHHRLCGMQLSPCENRQPDQARRQQDSHQPPAADRADEGKIPALAARLRRERRPRHQPQPHYQQHRAPIVNHRLTIRHGEFPHRRHQQDSHRAPRQIHVENPPPADRVHQNPSQQRP